MIVSVTEVQTFKRCRRQWNYSSFNGMSLTPIIQPKPYLDLGTMIHQSLAYWTQNPDTDLTQVFMAVAINHQNKVVAQYERATGHKPSDEELNPLMEAIVLGSAMAKNYQEFYGAPLPNNLRFCSPEQEILVPIPHTDHACVYCNGTGSIGEVSNCIWCHGSGTSCHYLKARLDALAQDTHSNIYVIERKTYDKRPNLDLLEVTDQFIGYVWIAQQLQLGSVAGIAYDGLWKRAHPPQRPKRLEMADLFVRTIITPAQDAVNEYAVELADTVIDMANNPMLYKNRVWQGCWDCSFEYLCRVQSEGGDTQYVINTQFTRRTEEDVSDIAETVEA